MRGSINHQDARPVLRERGTFTLKYVQSRGHWVQRGSPRELWPGGSHTLGSDTKIGGDAGALQRGYAEGTRALPEVTPRQGASAGKHGSLRQAQGRVPQSSFNSSED